MEIKNKQRRCLCNHSNPLLPELTPQGKVLLIGPIVHGDSIIVQCTLCLVYPPGRAECCGHFLAIRYFVCFTNRPHSNICMYVCMYVCMYERQPESKLVSITTLLVIFLQEPKAASNRSREKSNNQEGVIKALLPADHQPHTRSPTNVFAALSRINAYKAAGPDGIPNRMLRACAGQLTEVLTVIFKLSLAQAAIPTCFKTISIVPVPKHSTEMSLSDFHAVALTPTTMCFNRRVLVHLKTCLASTLDPFQFSNRQNRCMENAISTALHSALSHQDNTNTCVRMLFISFILAFNTIIPSKLITKLGDLGISTSLCSWILDFLNSRPQSVRFNNQTSLTLIRNTGIKQGCVPSPLLYSLFTYNCMPIHGSNIIIKFADDTMVFGLINSNDESAYREEVQHLVAWCADNNLALNSKTTKELTVAKSMPLVHVVSFRTIQTMIIFPGEVFFFELFLSSLTGTGSAVSEL